MQVQDYLEDRMAGKDGMLLETGEIRVADVVWG